MTPAEFKEARQTLGLSTSALARILNVAPQTVRKWEMPDHRSTARGVNPIAARVVQWMLDGFRPPEY